jgi:hypothetical protein
MTTVTHHHGDPVTAYPGLSCEGCVPDFAADFIARTAAQKGHFMVPAPADYMACDRTINEERERLRREYSQWSNEAVIIRLRQLGLDPLYVDRAAMSHRVEELVNFDRGLREVLVDAVCPRAWLDRRLREVL